MRWLYAGDRGSGGAERMLDEERPLPMSLVMVAKG